MTFVVKPSVNAEAVPSDVAKGIDGLLPDVVLGSVLALSEVAGPSLNLQVGTGNCFIKGYHVQISVAETIALTAGSTNHVYIALVRNGNSEVTGAQVTANTTGVDPSDSMKIATVVTVGSDITTITSVQRLVESEGVNYIIESGSTPADPLNTEDAKRYIVDSDANNQKLAYKMLANGAIREVIIWG